MKRAVLLFWLAVGTGFLLSPVTAITLAAGKGAAPVPAIKEWIGHLFEPGFNEFLIILVTAAPFLAAGVFILFHLSAVAAPRGRLAGAAALLCVGAAVSTWILIAIRTSRSSTASIGYIFMPFEVLFVMPFAYLAGRLVARWLPLPSHLT